MELRFRHPGGDDVVGIKHAQRRVGYGPKSQGIGMRGSRTRDRIVAETLALFSDRGFHDTTVRDIAEAAEVSRATLYQYFVSKDEIVSELREECGRALLDLAAGVGELGPTAEGFDQLRRWISAWSTVHDRYGVLFVRWSDVDLPAVSGSLLEYEQRVEAILWAGGLSDMSAADAGTLMIGAVNRYTFLRLAVESSSAQQPGAVDEVATVLQLALFPTTPRQILQIVQPHEPEPRGPRVVARTGRSRLADITAGRSARGAQTVQQILAAGAELFSERGYHGVSVDEILRRAGFTRGTFYKHFAEKLDLLLVLAEGFEAEELAQIRMREFQGLCGAHLGVIRCLIDRSPRDPDLDEASDRLLEVIAHLVSDLLDSGEIAEIVTVWGAQVVMVGALDHRPTAELVATMLERGLLGE